KLRGAVLLFYRPDTPGCLRFYLFFAAFFRDEPADPAGLFRCQRAPSLLHHLIEQPQLLSYLILQLLLRLQVLKIDRFFFFLSHSLPSFCFFRSIALKYRRHTKRDCPLSCPFCPYRIHFIPDCPV